MSTTPVPTTSPEEVEIKIVSHSNLFYWWPVWAVGFLMFILSYFDGHLLAVVPEKTRSEKDQTVIIENKPTEHRDVLVLPEGAQIPTDEKGRPIDPRLHTAQNKSYGVIFAIVLLVVIVITNVPLRGMWSVVIIISIILLSIIFALAGFWDNIFRAINLLHIHINAAGYLFISLALFVIWLITLFFFDQQLYMIFTPGQLKVRQEIGGGEKAYDTTGMHLEKQRSDLFRHWILGLGSGDLIVNTSGAQAHHFELHNVLFIGKKVQQIEDMLRERAVVRGR